MMNKATLKDELGTGMVPLWSPMCLVDRTDVPDGTMVSVITSPGLNGYVLVEINGDLFEVWHENLNRSLN